ncbi:MAG TPA: hypothetical protein VL134_08745, partial [Leptolyngbya sp.]|nr:hypothetical protein [Leptolyngbya sp.]
MSTQRVPLEAVQKIRQHLKAALIVPESENYPERYAHQDEPPTPESLEGLGRLFHFGGSLVEATQMPNRQGQWFISAVNPGSTFMKLPGLKLKSGLRLVSYLYQMDEDGTGITWAVPEQFSTTSSLEKALLAAGGRDMPPKPEGALTDFMSAIDGDQSLMSFVIASLLRRELLEFGKAGRFATWSDCRLIDRLPTSSQSCQFFHWQWRTEPPKDFSPKVQMFLDGRVAIEFFTYRATSPIAVFHHIDQYPAG